MSNKPKLDAGDVRTYDRPQRNGEVLGALVPGEIVEIRRTVNGKTAAYVVEIAGVEESSAIKGGPAGVTLRGRATLYGYSSHADGRVQRQADTIDRMLEHLRHDCPEVGGGRTCAHMERMRQREAR